MKNDMLKQMFDIQYQAQETRGTWDKIKDPEMHQQFVNQMLLACHEEVTEIMRETAYKNPNFVPFGWKKKQEWNEDNYKEEIIDLMHFVMNLFLAVNGTPEEFFEIYKEKNKENIERWKGDY